MIATAATAHIMALTGDEAELEKRITSLLVSGASWILMDNVTVLDSSVVKRGVDREHLAGTHPRGLQDGQRPQ